MRLKHLTAAGFRGFNSERQIAFHDKLSLISAPNSHGKTSIIEALEFLLYGQTSKVESADSKDEYRDSYHNRHYPAGQPVMVEAVCVDDTTLDETVLRIESDASGIRRFANGKPVSSWPFDAALSSSARPFVVQHALKSLLLAAPADRFQGFARLLGLREVDAVQQALVNLCTKPESQIQTEAKKHLSDLSLFDNRLRAIRETLPIAKAIAKGSASFDDAFVKLHARGEKLVGKRLSESGLSSALVEVRNDAASKVFAGSVAIGEFGSADRQRTAAARDRIERVAQGALLTDYSRLALGDTVDRLRREFRILDLGLDLLAQSPGQCPFCSQDVSEPLRLHVTERHKELQGALGAEPDAPALRTNMQAALKELGHSITTHSAAELGRCTDLIAANTPESNYKIKALFGKGKEYALFLIAGAGADIAPVHKALQDGAAAVSTAIEVCTDATQRKTEEIAQMEALVAALGGYLKRFDEYSAKLAEVRPTLEEPTQLLRTAVDAQAGTSELSLLIEMLSNRSLLRRAVRIKEMLDGLRDLRRLVDQAVGQTMENAFSSDLTGAVMKWYERIRTTSDPDVHFSGFAMERTKAGDFKNRRVKVAAHSYGVELASAVSSLSESKLNALGLCMSIATALRSPGPWSFLVLDDPIQSWDNDHEIQFISILRALAEDEGRQVILMSHRADWIDQVTEHCRSLNGVRYHITGYDRDGPTIQELTWATIDQRLSEALAIAKDPAATPVRLQHAEEEIRLALCQLAADVATRKLGRTTGAHSLNSARVRSILNEAGCPLTLADRVVATFGTTDPAHHVTKGYTANAERVRQYHGALIELKNHFTEHVQTSKKQRVV